jgi:hypothetical protein
MPMDCYKLGEFGVDSYKGGGILHIFFGADAKS